MRPLTDDEMKALFEKLQTYIGGNVSKLVDRSDEPFTFRMLNDRVYYLRYGNYKYFCLFVGNVSVISLFA